MSRITERDIRLWADEQGIPGLLFAELDYRLIQILEALYGDDLLSERLCIKGGTAINKLYLGETSRLSIDLDFNHLGRKDDVLRERREVRERIIELLRRLDSYVIHSKHRYEQTTIKSRYDTITGTNQNIKIEISHIERFPIIPKVERRIKTPDGQIDVITYTIEELTATKLRALLERSKGRDVYDLYFISRLNPDPDTTRKMFLYYFYRSRKVYNPKVHYRNLVKRYDNGAYTDDVSIFVKPSVTFDLGEATRKVLSYYSFLNELDAQDKGFLKLAGMLIGRKISEENATRLKEIKNPLKKLFDPIEISREAQATSLDDIKLYSKRKSGKD